MRYALLNDIIRHVKPKVIVEVGTWNGLRAMQMIAEAVRKQPNVHYIGFDLFETATPELNERELNVKASSTLEAVTEKLAELQKKVPGMTFELHRGDTRVTLKDFKLEDPENTFVFLDGGHSVETIRNDYEALKSAKTVVFDDFYSKDEEGRCPDIEKFGCNKVVENIDRIIIPTDDRVKDGGKVGLVVSPATSWPGEVNFVVKTKNCVPDEEIQSNIRYSVERIEKWVMQVRPHDRVAVLISGGPGFKDHLEEYKARQARGELLVCVKHSHDWLLENGVVPWATMLLDPRSHVQDFIENPHPGVLYFCASMCHPTTVDRLLEKGANVMGYHALVGGGEDKTIPPRINGQPQFMIGGGSTSAIRGVSVLYSIGFRKFVLFGYDSCYWDESKIDWKEKTKTGAPKYLKVTTLGRTFTTDAELLAQSQDFDKLVQLNKDIDLEVMGDGMVSHIWSVVKPLRLSFEDVFVG